MIRVRPRLMKVSLGWDYLSLGTKKAKIWTQRRQRSLSRTEARFESRTRNPKLIDVANDYRLNESDEYTQRMHLDILGSYVEEISRTFLAPAKPPKVDLFSACRRTASS